MNAATKKFLRLTLFSTILSLIATYLSRQYLAQRNKRKPAQAKF